jgi:hypothetical protein
LLPATSFLTLLMAIDFPGLKNQLTQATQAAFTEVLAQHLAEGIYSFALYSDEGAMTVCPATNTLAHLAAQPLEDQVYAKFEPAEWRYENVGATAQFAAICRQLATQALDETLEDQAFEQFRQQLYTTCIDVLADLQQQGFFDQAAGQEVFLLRQRPFSGGVDTARHPAQPERLPRRVPGLAAHLGSLNF